VGGADAGAAADAAHPAFAAARKVGESFVIAVVTSTGLYLVGSVYTGSYYSRLSVDVASLDLAPAYVAVQAIHALPGLLQYPLTLLALWLLYRTFAAPGKRFAAEVGRLRARHPRGTVVAANLLLVGPLLGGALALGIDQSTGAPDAVLAELAGVLTTVSLVLLVYAVWLGWSQRASLADLIRARAVLPIGLIGLVYLLHAMAGTSGVAEAAAIRLMTGQAGNSLGIELTLADDVDPDWGDAALVLVIQRQVSFFVVERQPIPPAQRPRAWVVPAGSVETARVQRLTDADDALVTIVIE
jgi:hypothetical protein